MDADLALDDFQITIKRTDFKWTCEIVGIPMPRDVHQAQKFLSNYYRAQRTRLAENYKKGKHQRDALMAEVKELERKKKSLEGDNKDGPRSETNGNSAEQRSGAKAGLEGSSTRSPQGRTTTIANAAGSKSKAVR